MSAPAPRPLLTFEQTLELVRYSTLTESAYGSTLQTGPLAYHGLIWTPDRSARHVITERGRRWLATWDAYRAARATATSKVTPAQLGALRAIERGHGHVGTKHTRAALYERGLIDWVPMDGLGVGRTWQLTDAGRALLDASAGVEL